MRSQVGPAYVLGKEFFYNQAQSAKLSLTTEEDITDEKSLFFGLAYLLFHVFDDTVDQNKSNTKNHLQRYAYSLTFVVRPLREAQSQGQKAFEGFIKASPLPNKLYKEIKGNNTIIKLSRPGHALDVWSPAMLDSEGYKIYSFKQEHKDDQKEKYGEDEEYKKIEDQNLEKSPYLEESQMISSGNLQENCIIQDTTEKFELSSQYLDIPSTTVSGELNNKLQVLETENTALSGQVQSLSTEVNTLHEAIQEKDQKIGELNGKIEVLSNEISTLQTQVNEKDTRISDLEKRMIDMSKTLEKLVDQKDKEETSTRRDTVKIPPPESQNLCTLSEMVNLQESKPMQMEVELANEISQDEYGNLTKEEQERQIKLKGILNNKQISKELVQDYLKYLSRNSIAQDVKITSLGFMSKIESTDPRNFPVMDFDLINKKFLIIPFRMAKDKPYACYIIANPDRIDKKSSGRNTEPLRVLYLSNYNADESRGKYLNHILSFLAALKEEKAKANKESNLMPLSITENRKTTPTQKLSFRKDLIKNVEPESVQLPFSSNLNDNAVLLLMNIEAFLVSPKKYFIESKTSMGFGRNYGPDQVQKRRLEIHDILKSRLNI